MQEQTCKNCNHSHLLKELVDGKWIYKSVCTLFPEQGSDYFLFALVVNDEDMCEEFSERISSPIYEAYKILADCMNNKGTSEAEAIETALGYLGQALEENSY